MRCNYCDYKVNEDTIICPNCGEDVHTTKKNVIKENKSKEEKESPKIQIDGDYSILFGLLGFFIPLAGLVLFLVWINTKPKDAKAAGLGALIRVILYVVLAIAFVFLQAIVNG